MIKLGTAGFQYKDWQGEVYPPELPERDRLRHYATLFPAVELDFTYYRIPPALTFIRMLEKVPSRFEFAVKLPKPCTHDIAQFEPAVTYFRRAIEPLVRAGQLACLLAQFPPSFRPSAASTAHLQLLREAFPSTIPIDVEFRHLSWLTDDTLYFLRDEGLGFVNVDQPQLPGLLPPTDLATTDVGYIRFHGRNARTWWEHEAAWQRYDYLYTTEELQTWVPRIERLQDRVGRLYVVFNNHFRGKSVRNALALAQLLKLPPTPTASGRPLPAHEHSLFDFDLCTASVREASR